MGTSYKLIIADDEEKICTLLKSSIHWETLNLELCAVCHNGLELKQKIRECRPDILVTDICMPGINAIDLIRDLRNEGNQLKILLVSGYRKFDYAREALKYGVDNYLLKPIDEQELNDALEKMCIELGIEKHRLLPDNTEKIKTTLQSFLARDMKNGTFDGRMITIEEVNRRYYAEFQPGCFRVICVKIDITDGDAERIDLQLVQNKIREKCMAELEKIHIDTIVSFELNGVVFTVNYEEDKDSLMRQTAKMVLEYALEVISLFVGLSITVGMGSMRETVCQIVDSYREAEEALIYRIVSKTNKVYVAEELDMPRKEQYLTESESKELLRCFDPGDPKLFRLIFQKMIYGKIGNIYILYKVLEECVLLFEKNLVRVGQEMEEGESAVQKLLYEMQQALSVTGLIQTVEEGICCIIAEIEKERKQKANKPVRDAKEYVKKHFAEKIRLEDVAGEVGLNPAYFSSVFSKEEGMTFTDYVNDYRVEMAKELLRSGKYTVAETCDMVGIGNQRYFSKLFKSKVGVKPVEYRKLYN